MWEVVKKRLINIFLYCAIVIGISSCSGSTAQSNVNTNTPWYPSIDAFEHYDSGRSHLFADTYFGGNYTGNNVIGTSLAPSSYPSVYNMTYLSPSQIYAYGGGYGNRPGSIGAYVAQINAETLEPVWYTQLIDTESNGEWDYPGVMGILNDGMLYVVYGYRLSKIDPNTGSILSTLILPSGEAESGNTAYNGFDATPDGTLVMKSIYRESGCLYQGTDAVSDCPNPESVPNSILVSVNPKTMQILDQVNLPAPIFGRLTVGSYNNKNYVYLFGPSSLIRYTVGKSGKLALDPTWNTGNILLAGQNAGSALIVLNDWVVGQGNGSPAPTALSLIAVNQGNAATQFSIQPFIDDPIPLLNRAVFSPNISWMPSSVSADPNNNMIYAMDAVPGKIAAIQLDSNGLHTRWKADQKTTEFIAIIGPENQRVIVGTDIPKTQVPGDNENDYVVWRDATTGTEIARSSILPNMTAGSMVQPSYSGNMFYEGIMGNLYKLSPTQR